MSMRKYPPKPGQAGHNVVPMHGKPSEPRIAGCELQDGGAGPETFATAGSPDDPRMQEAMRLMEAFLAIEDAEGRAALITLAERLVSHDWVRNAQRR